MQKSTAAISMPSCPICGPFDGFQVYGHLDYIVRYGHGGATTYHCSDYADIIDEILKTAIEKGIGIELNTSGLKYGLGFAHPHRTF